MQRTVGKKFSEGLSLHTLNEVKPQINALLGPVNGRFPSSVIHTRFLNEAADHAGFVDVRFRGIKPAKIIEASGHVLQRPVGLQE